MRKRKGLETSEEGEIIDYILIPKNRKQTTFTTDVDVEVNTNPYRAANDHALLSSKIAFS